MTDQPPRTGFRPLRVTRRTQETALVTSFWLEPVEPEGWRAFQAGQFLSFRLPSTDARGKMLRNYSLASAPHETGRYGICVKRESAQTAVQGGQGSGYFHDHVHAGDILFADGPRGNFILKNTGRPMVMISAGIGITPLVAMLKTAARQSQQPIIFIHECDSAAAHIMRDEIAALAAVNSAISLHPVYRDAQPPLDTQFLRPLLPADCEVYLCGPTPFMQRAYAALRENGIAPGQIAHEFFGPLIDLERAWQTR